MKELTITIFETSEGEYQYDVYDSAPDAIVNDEIEAYDGGVCTTTMDNALGMAVDTAKELIAHFKSLKPKQ